MRTFFVVENLQLVCRLLVSVDESEPHGGGVRVEKLKLEVFGELRTQDSGHGVRVEKVRL